jgi:hypothetical protein
MSDNNGKANVTFKWVVGILMTLVFGLAGGWAMDMNGRVAKLEQQNYEQSGQLARITARQEMVLESLTELRSGQADIRGALDRNLAAFKAGHWDKQ